MSDEALAARMEAGHYARLREREIAALLRARESLSIEAQEDEEDLEAESAGHRRPA